MDILLRREAEASCPLGHQPPSKVPMPLPDAGPAGMLTPGPLAMEEERNFFQHHPQLVQTPHQAGARLPCGAAE